MVGIREEIFANKVIPIPIADDLRYTDIHTSRLQ